MTVTPAVVCDALSCGYGARPVLTDVSLSIAPGELLCLLGVNGAGKTTLLRAMAGLLAPRHGTVRISGHDPARAARRLLARAVCYLPQRYDLALPFTVAEVVLMGRYPHHGGWLGLETDADHDAARAAMARCDVVGLADRHFDALSGGEQRRALLAQALCQRTEVLLLDEPTASLDPSHAIAIFAALREVAGSAAVVVVTHDLNLAARFADRVAILTPADRPGDGARLAALGPPAEIVGTAVAATAFGVALHTGIVPGTALRFAVPH